MASSRVIRKGLRSSEVIGQLSFKEIWLYEGLLFEADDYGLFEARSKSLRRDITGEKEDEFTVEEVESFLQRASDLGLVILYEVDGRRYGWVQKFRQQIRVKRSFFPTPPGYVIRDKRLIADDNQMPANDKHLHNTCIADDNHVIGKNEENCSVSELGEMSSTCTTNDKHLPTDDNQMPANAHLEKEKEKVKERVRERVRERDEAAPNGLLDFPPPSRPSSMVPLPESVEEVEEHMRQCFIHPLDPEALRSSAERFYDHYVEQGNFIRNWKSKATIWTKDDAYREQERKRLEKQQSGEERDPFDPKLRKNINPQ